MSVIGHDAMINGFIVHVGAYKVLLGGGSEASWCRLFSSDLSWDRETSLVFVVFCFVRFAKSQVAAQ